MFNFRLLLALLAITCLGHSQASTATPTEVFPNNTTGIAPYQTYGGNAEDINYATGGLHVSIPLINFPGRNGLNLNLNLVYDSKLWLLQHVVDQQGSNHWFWNLDDRLHGLDGLWTLSVPRLQWTSVRYTSTTPIHSCESDFILTMPDGSKHSYTGALGGGIKTHCYLQNSTGWVADPSYDSNVGGSGGGSYVELDTSNEADVVARTKDGTQIHFTNPAFVTGGGGSGSRIASSIVDTDGNTITINAPLDCCGNDKLVSITDTDCRLDSRRWHICHACKSSGEAKFDVRCVGSRSVGLQPCWISEDRNTAARRGD